jgi:hypothetical protein
LKEDVAKCVQAMVDKGYKMPVFQFGAKKYKALEADQSKVTDACKGVEKEAIYVINLDTRKVHKKDCRCKGKNVVGARLASIKTTGLINCMICMK